MKLYLPYLDWIDTQRPMLLTRLKQWVSINTFSWNLDGLAKQLSQLQTDFDSLKGNQRVLELPQQRVLASNGNFEQRSFGQALQIRKRPSAPIQILFGGHMDTVYPASSSFQNIEVVDDKIWKGPGVADMKGGVAILLTTLEALERSPFSEQIGWEILLTPDEEIGSPGSAIYYQEAAKRHQLGFIFEPTLPDGSFVSQRMGSTTYTLVIHGIAAHVGRDFDKGKSAVFPLARIITQIEALLNQKDLIVNVAEVEGKGPVNIVPPLASCRINLRSSNSDILKKASLKLMELVKLSAQDGLRIEIVQDAFRAPKSFDAKTQRLFQNFAQCAKELNIPFQTRSTGGVCDGNILAEAGLPTLDTAGAIGGALHTTEEYILMDSLVERSKLMALFLYKLTNQD